MIRRPICYLHRITNISIQYYANKNKAMYNKKRNQLPYIQKRGFFMSPTPPNDEFYLFYILLGTYLVYRFNKPSPPPDEPSCPVVY